VGSQADADNRPRFGTRPGHVESWFLRANDPASARAFWLRATVLVPLGAAPAVAEVWACTFDPSGGGSWGARARTPLAEASFRGGPLRIEAAGCRFEAGTDGGRTEGSVEGRRGSCRWDLAWRRAPGLLGEPACLLPSRRLLDTGFPRSKPLTPVPAASFSGEMEWSGRPVEVRGWAGMQGHNWGREHAWEYAWGQVVFPGEDGAPAAWVEGFTARVRVGGFRTPLLSAMVVRRGDREHRFDGLFDAWRQDASIGPDAWTLALRGRAGRARLEMRSRPDRTLCLAYGNPDGQIAYCRNSKLAEARLEVEPRDGAPFVLGSASGGALELLSRTADPRFPDPV